MVLQKAIIKKSKKKEGYRDIDEGHPSQYDAPEGSARDEHLDKTTAALKDDDPSNDDAAWAAREREEEKHRKTETVKVTRDQIKELVRGAIEEELSKKDKSNSQEESRKKEDLRQVLYMMNLKKASLPGELLDLEKECHNINGLTQELILHLRQSPGQ